MLKRSLPLSLSPSLPHRFLVLLAAVLLLITAGCDDTAIDPFANDDRFFTVFGFIDVLEREHKIRVIPVARTPEKIESPAGASIDATVTSVDLNTGARHQWDHQVERLSNDLFAHVYTAFFRVDPDHTYRLEIGRSDGATTWAETTVPTIANPALFERGAFNVSADSG